MGRTGLHELKFYLTRFPGWRPRSQHDPGKVPVPCFAPDDGDLIRGVAGVIDAFDIGDSPVFRRGSVFRRGAAFQLRQLRRRQLDLFSSGLRRRELPVQRDVIVPVPKKIQPLSHQGKTKKRFSRLPGTVIGGSSRTIVGNAGVRDYLVLEPGIVLFHISLQGQKFVGAMAGLSAYRGREVCKKNQE